MVAVMQGKRLFSGVFAITERKDMGLYDVRDLVYVFVGFWDGDYVSQHRYV